MAVPFWHWNDKRKTPVKPLFYGNKLARGSKIDVSHLFG